MKNPVENSLRDFFLRSFAVLRAVGADLVGARNDVSGDFSVAILLRNDKFAV